MTVNHLIKPYTTICRIAFETTLLLENTTEADVDMPLSCFYSGKRHDAILLLYHKLLSPDSIVFYHTLQIEHFDITILLF